MATKTLSLSLLFFIISAHGRSLQKSYNGESVDLSHAFSSLQSTTYTGKTNISDGKRNRNLRNKLLSGVLPDFTSMDALQRIDLSINAFYGTIPSFLGRFPDLQELHLDYNLFSGLVPDSLACNKNLDISVDQNAGLSISNKCWTTWNDKYPSSWAPTDVNSDSSVPVPATRSSKSTKKKKKSSMPVILGTTIPLFALFWIAFGVFAMYRHKTKAAAAIAEANKQGASGSKDNIPAEERPMNERPNNMSP